MLQFSEPLYLSLLLIVVEFMSSVSFPLLSFAVFLDFPCIDFTQWILRLLAVSLFGFQKIPEPRDQKCQHIVRKLCRTTTHFCKTMEAYYRVGLLQYHRPILSHCAKMQAIINTNLNQCTKFPYQMAHNRNVCVTSKVL